MQILFSLLISALSLKLAILGCDPTKCTEQVKTGLLAQADYIVQYATTEISKGSGTSSAPIVESVTPLAPLPPTPVFGASVTPPPPPPATPLAAPVVQGAHFVGTPTYALATTSSGIIVQYSWQTDTPTTATFSLCPQQWNCVSQGTTGSNSFTIERPASGVEWIEIRLSDTEFFRTQRPQL